MAGNTAEILNLNTVALYFYELRILICNTCKENLDFTGETEVAEKYLKKAKREKIIYNH